jgi:hypothetical protein
VPLGVFELPLLRNAQKRHKIKALIKKKGSAYLPHLALSADLVAICQADTRRFQIKIFSAPRIELLLGGEL